MMPDVGSAMTTWDYVTEVLKSPVVNSALLFVLGILSTKIRHKRRVEMRAETEQRELVKGILEDIGRLKGSQARAWEKLSTLRRAFEETTKCKIHEPDWDRPPPKDS